MCPEEIEALVDELDGVASPWKGDGKQVAKRLGVPEQPGHEADLPHSGKAFGIVDQRSTQRMHLAYVDALPTLALTMRLVSDPTIASWVEELHRLAPEPRALRIHDLAKGAPRGIGRVVIAELLTRAAASGKTYSFLSAAAFSAFVEPLPKDAPEALRRSPKRGSGGRGDHDKMLSLVRVADRIVETMVARQEGREPPKTLEPDRRAAQRLLQEVGVHILRARDPDRPTSPSRARRLASG